MRQDGNTTAIDLSYVSYVRDEHVYGGWYRCTLADIELIALGQVLREPRAWERPLIQARCMLRRLVDAVAVPARAAINESGVPVTSRCCSAHHPPDAADRSDSPA